MERKLVGSNSADSQVTSFGRSMQGITVVNVEKPDLTYASTPTIPRRQSSWLLKIRDRVNLPRKFIPRR